MASNGQQHTGRFAFDDKARRVVWNIFAVFGILVFVALVALAVLIAVGIAAVN